MVKKKIVLLSFLCPSGSSAEADSYKVQTQHTLLLWTNQTCCEGAPQQQEWATSRWALRTVQLKILLNHPQMTRCYNWSFSKYSMWNWKGAKIICTHNSLYHHLNFKNCNDIFCKSNRFLVVPHATQLLLIILCNIHFTHQENTLRNTCSVFSSSILVCVCYWCIKFVLMIMTNFLKLGLYIPNHNCQSLGA